MNITLIIAAFITGVAGPVVVILLKNYISKRRHLKVDAVQDAIQVSNIVNTKLEAILDESDADRACIMQFHNGGHFYPTGKSMAKFSMLYETVTPNAKSIQSNFQNVPVNLFCKQLNFVLENDYLEIIDYQDREKSFGLENIAEVTNSKSTYFFAIKTFDDKFVGILGLGYTNKVVQLTQNEISHLQIQAAQLGGLLMNYLSKQN